MLATGEACGAGLAPEAAMSDQTHPFSDGTRLARSATDLYDALRRFFVRRLRPSERAEAEDLVQDVFVHLAARAASGGEQVERTNAYVYITAANVLRDRSRRRTVRRADAHDSFDADLHVAFEDRTPERVFVGKQSIERVQAALLELPARTRTVFILFRFEEMSRPEIARDLGISVSLVEKELAKAVRHLMDRLGASP
jgi:RNA polymerase sigma-70 factor (ECF subfamily)